MPRLPQAARQGELSLYAEAARGGRPLDLKGLLDQARELADDAAAEGEHADDEHGALRDRHPEAERSEVVLHREDDERADDWPEDRSQAADQRHEHHFA